MKISVAIADDHPLSVKGLHNMLADSAYIRIDATWVDADALIAGLEGQMPDVLLLGIGPGIRPEQELLLLIHKAYPVLNILVLTHFDHALYIDLALKNGASGYLLRNADQDTIIRAIEAVHCGHLFLEDEHSVRLQQYRHQLRRKPTSRYPFTPREKDILTLIIEGLSSQEIAHRLYLSPRTVENYRLNLCIKLEVKNTAGLVRKAIELNLAGN